MYFIMAMDFFSEACADITKKPVFPSHTHAIIFLCSSFVLFVCWLYIRLYLLCMVWMETVCKKYKNERISGGNNATQPSSKHNSFAFLLATFLNIWIPL